MNEFDDLAQSQHGLLTAAQATELFGRTAFRRAVARGQLVGAGKGVFRCAGARVTFRQRAMAACLSYGPPVAISHASAAALWGYELILPGPALEISIPRHRSGRQPGVRTHRVAISEADIDRRYGIAITSPGRTLLDLAGSVPPDVLERSVDDALRGPPRHGRGDRRVVDRRGSPPPRRRPAPTPSRVAQLDGGRGQRRRRPHPQMDLPGRAAGPGDRFDRRRGRPSTSAGSRLPTRKDRHRVQRMGVPPDAVPDGC